MAQRQVSGTLADEFASPDVKGIYEFLTDPYYAFFEMKVYGEKGRDAGPIKIIGGDTTENLVSVEIEMTADGDTAEITLALFDETYELGEIFLNIDKTSWVIDFRWGYVTTKGEVKELSSGIFQGRIKECIPSFTPGGVDLNIKIQGGGDVITKRNREFRNFSFDMLRKFNVRKEGLIKIEQRELYGKMGTREKPEKFSPIYNLNEAKENFENVEKMYDERKQKYDELEEHYRITKDELDKEEGEKGFWDGPKQNMIDDVSGKVLKFIKTDEGDVESVVTVVNNSSSADKNFENVLKTLKELGDKGLDELDEEMESKDKNLKEKQKVVDDIQEEIDRKKEELRKAIAKVPAMNIWQIVNFLCVENEWGLKFDEKPQELLTKEEKPVYIQKNETSYQFIKRIAKYAKHSDKGIGYTAWKDSIVDSEEKFKIAKGKKWGDVIAGKSGNEGTLYFYPIKKSLDPPFRTFFINMDPNSEVLSFTPTIKPEVVGHKGGQDVQVNYVTQIGKSLAQDNVVVAMEEEKSKISVSRKEENRYKTRIKTLINSEQSGDFYAKAQMNNTFFTAEASLEILGDPRIRPGFMYVDIYFTGALRKTKDGDKFFQKMLPGTGKYRVESLTHSISGGGYTTSLNLKQGAIDHFVKKTTNNEGKEQKSSVKG